MRQNFGPKPILYPQPVFILAAYNADGSANAMNAAWGGISDNDEVTLCVSAEHKTTEALLARKAFTVSMGTEDTVIPCDYVGVVSGNDVPDKLIRAGFHAVKSEFVDAPLIEELPMAVECELKRYDPESGCLVGRVVNVCADERVLTDGKIDPARLKPIIFDGANLTYMGLGKVVGQAFHDGMKLK